MRIADWAARLARLPALGDALESAVGLAEWRSLAFEARPMLLAACQSLQPRKTVVVAANAERALTWQARLALCGIPQDQMFQLPSGTSALFEDALPEHIAISDRLGALRALASPEPCIVFATPQSALERTIPKDLLIQSFIDLKEGQDLELKKLIDSLASLGYEQQDPVRIPGQFVRRGGILDIFAAGHDLPVRIELMGDQIESIRLFDPNSQRSVGAVPAISIVPSRETLVTAGFEGLKQLLLDAMEREAAVLDDESAARLEIAIAEDADHLAARRAFDRLDLYRPLLYPDSGCALDLLEDEGLVVLDEPLELDPIAARAEEELDAALQSRAGRGEILHGTAHDYVLPPESLGDRPHCIAMTAMNSMPEWFQAPVRTDWAAVSLRRPSHFLLLRGYG